MNIIAPVIPGRILKHDFLEPLNMSPSDFSEKSGISLDVVSGILEGTQRITPEIAEQLHIYFDIGVNFWLKIQKKYDDDILADALEKLEYMAHRKRENIQNNKEKEDFQDLKELVDIICKI